MDGQVTTQDRGFRCDRVRLQLFDVAIEDKDKAVEAVRHHSPGATGRADRGDGELHNGSSLSPGRVKSR